MRAALADAALSPMTVRRRLAQRFVLLYHGAEAAQRAEQDFETQFSRRETPEHLEEFHRAAVMAAVGNAPRAGVVELLVAAGFAASKGAAARPVAQGAVRIDGGGRTGLD